MSPLRIATVLLLLAFSALPTYAELPHAADVNDDGRVNITDPVFLLGVLFGGGREIPEPTSRSGRQSIRR